MSAMSKLWAEEPLDEVIARDPAMLAVLAMAQTVARHKAAVLITGETGTGKELVARMIHRYSGRNSRPWVDVNCAALPEHLVESELFGYEKGAFSGANCVKPGLFETANGGTLFLDEIGEIDPKVQVKLLRVLDGVPYYRLGGNRKVKVDVRLVAATNRKLEAAVQSGLFRSDLYHRISEIHIRIPALRERPQDIVALAEHFLTQRRPEMSFNAQALELLSQLPWTGNVRELRNLVLKLGILTSHEQISADDVSRQIRDGQESATTMTPPQPEKGTTLNELERLMILRTLEATGGNQSLAAEQLGIPRRTFCRKLNQHHINLGRRNRSVSQVLTALPSNYRAELKVPVTLRTAEGASFLAETRNLSEGGLGLQNLQTPLAIADSLVLKFMLPGAGRQMEMKATVVWWQSDGTAGTRFAQLSASHINVLRNWMAKNFQRQIPSADERQTPLSGSFDGRLAAAFSLPPIQV